MSGRLETPRTYAWPMGLPIDPVLQRNPRSVDRMLYRRRMDQNSDIHGAGFNALSILVDLSSSSSIGLSLST